MNLSVISIIYNLYIFSNLKLTTLIPGFSILFKGTLKKKILNPILEILKCSHRFILRYPKLIMTSKRNRVH